MYKLHASNFEKDPNKQFFEADIPLTCSKKLGNVTVYFGYDIYTMTFVSRSRDKKTGHAKSDTKTFLARWIEITRKCFGIDIST